MIEWWNDLDTLLKVLYCVAVPSTLILIIQTVMSMLGGMDSGAGMGVSDTSGLSDLSGVSGGFDASGFDASAAAGGFDAGQLNTAFDGSPNMGELADATDMGDIQSGQHVMDGGNPADFSTLRLFTLQSIVAFMTVFGWSAIASITSGAATTLSVLLGIAFGLVAMFAIAKLVQVSSKLTENGTVNLKNAIGETGKVYIPIPSRGKGEGKLTMYLQGRYMECDAVTDDENILSTGTAVRIVDFRNGVLVVEREN